MAFSDDQWHDIAVRIYYEDTDFSGVVYHANYLRFAERGRSDCLRDLGIRHSDLAALEQPLVFVVSDMNIRYVQPARIDDVLTVRTRFTAARGARLSAEQQIYRDQTLLWTAQVAAACVDLSGRPRRLPTSLMAGLNRHVEAGAWPEKPAR